MVAKRVKDRVTILDNRLRNVVLIFGDKRILVDDVECFLDICPSKQVIHNHVRNRRELDHFLDRLHTLVNT